jgi:uncharacterized protein DUF3291
MLERMWHLAQANTARQRAPLDSPVMAEFVVALDPVNRIAEQSPGFVWRLRSSESHGATTLWEGSSPSIVNLSVWESYDALHAFVYRSPHGAYLRRRARWFEPTRQPSTVLWWVERASGRRSMRRCDALTSCRPVDPRRRPSPSGGGSSRMASPPADAVLASSAELFSAVVMWRDQAEHAAESSSRAAGWWSLVGPSSGLDC